MRFLFAQRVYFSQNDLKTSKVATHSGGLQDCQICVFFARAACVHSQNDLRILRSQLILGACRTAQLRIAAFLRQIQAARPARGPKAPFREREREREREGR